MNTMAYLFFFSVDFVRNMLNMSRKTISSNKPYKTSESVPLSSLNKSFIDITDTFG